MSLVSLRNLGRISISIFPKFPNLSNLPKLPIKNLYYELTAKATNNIL